MTRLICNLIAGLLLKWARILMKRKSLGTYSLNSLSTRRQKKKPLIMIRKLSFIGIRKGTPSLTVFDARQLIKQLREFLTGKRYLIVIDDIWDTNTWEVIMKPAFVESNCGSRIIATTRMSDVAETIGEPYEIQQLSDDCSRKLLSKIIFGREDELENDKVAEKIIHKCHGVPLAITSIASLLAPPKQRHEWSNVYESIFLNSIGSEPDKNQKVDNAMKILSFSYYHLPCYLRTCMLYLSVFPEDEYVDKNMLIWRWIAEGLVRNEEGKGLFEVGDSYFRQLINRGLIQPSKDGSGILGGCHVHDFVLRLIRNLSKEENFVSVVDSEQRLLSLPAECKVRRLALQNISDTEDGIVEVDHMDMSVVRSFNAMYTNKVPPVSGFELLRVLALEYCGVEEGYLNLIGKLGHLRYLGLTGTRTSKLPEEVGYLKFLQTLMLHETGIEELPKSLEQRTQLMCLRGDEKTRVPEWIGKLTSLVELQMYPGAKGKCFVEELGKLRHIRVLKAKINLQDEGEARDLLVSLSKLEGAEIIVVVAVSMMGVIRLSEDAMQPNLVLNCKNVSVLELRALIFPRLPACINAQDLPKLNKLCLCVNVLEQQDMEILGRFQQLYDLSISGPVPDGVDSIVIRGGDGFQNLATLTSSANIKFAAGAMPRLEAIKLWINAYDVMNVGNHVLNLGLGNIYSLQQVTAIIVCSNCFPAEVEEMEAAVNHVVDIHPNWPTLSVMRYGEDGMATTDSGLLDRWKIKELELGIQLIKHVNLHTRLLTEVADKLVYYDDSMAVLHPNSNKMKEKLQAFQDQSFDGFETEIYGQILWSSKDGKYRDYRQQRDRFWDQYKAKIHNNLLSFQPDRDVHRVMMDQHIAAPAETPQAAGSEVCEVKERNVVFYKMLVKISYTDDDHDDEDAPELSIPEIELKAEELRIAIRRKMKAGHLCHVDLDRS
ncbi:disease resistance protein RGA5 isoform X2 [Setaria viridis]|uniref:Uncharacterized protein n=1 Tax=Setaria viridis TaxID=4556 RepID=A0A4V6D3M6_SETVI|nr:disease resistance protein RGA5-like isoform X2 [Setaria viridis]TKW02656.1 hypothetical protein SEVIR_8G254400v2 [Setaria viridis]